VDGGAGTLEFVEESAGFASRVSSVSAAICAVIERALFTVVACAELLAVACAGLGAAMLRLGATCSASIAPS
jgi:hypothetical protein